MRPGWTLLAAPGAVVADAPPAGTTAEHVARFDAAAASLGCTLPSAGGYLAMEIQTGLARQKLLDLVAYRVSTGDAARQSGGGLKLTTGACA